MVKQFLNILFLLIPVTVFCQIKKKDIIDVNKPIYVRKYSCADYSRFLYFEFKKYNLQPNQKKRLDLIASRLITVIPETNFRIGGHTNGSEKRKKRLSKRRAIIVMNYLISKGVSPKRLSVKSYAFKYPIADDSTAEGQLQNRRVEIRMIDKIL